MGLGLGLGPGLGLEGEEGPESGLVLDEEPALELESESELVELRPYRRCSPHLTHHRN